MSEEYVIHEWWLVRHAPINTDKIYGHLDLEADFSDTQRLAEIARMLPEGSHFITSDLSRSIETARGLQTHEKFAKNLDIRAGLREQGFGAWEGRTHAEIEKSEPDAYRRFWADPAQAKTERGESFQDLIRRVDQEMKNLLQDMTSRQLVIVTHAGVIRAMVGRALGIAPQKMLALAIDPLSVTHLTSFSRGEEVSWRINFLNDRGGEGRLRR